MSEISKHTGTTIIHSKMLANNPEFWNTEKAKKLFEKIIPDSNEEWKKQYQIIISHNTVSVQISKEEALKFCGRSENNYKNWSKRPPVKRIDLLNLLLLHGYSLTDLDSVDYIFSRIAHLARPSMCTTIDDMCFLFCCEHMDFRNDILPIIRKKEKKGSPLFYYSGLANSFLNCNTTPRQYVHVNVNKGRFKEDQANKLIHFFSYIEKKKKKVDRNVKSELNTLLHDKINQINVKRKEQGKTLFSTNYLKTHSNLPKGFTQVISRYGRTDEDNVLKRDYAIVLCLHYAMNIDEINNILDILQMDELVYKNPLDLVIIYTVTQLSKNGKYDIDMSYEQDIVPIICRSNALLSVFGDNYIIVQKEVLKYFEGFQSKNDYERR